MARKIQEGERANGKPDFQGFVFEGKASESLTCNALEWIIATGVALIEPDKKVTINNSNAIKALETAKTVCFQSFPLSTTTRMYSSYVRGLDAAH
ncbi:MAG: hypothetical protein JO279_19025 [Verrucomicrobia bacterium]|nr:hypothetical protein [Verrucomicrobiota bacterium]